MVDKNCDDLTSLLAAIDRGLKRRHKTLLDALAVIDNLPNPLKDIVRSQIDRIILGLVHSAFLARAGGVLKAFQNGSVPQPDLVGEMSQLRETLQGMDKSFDICLAASGSVPLDKDWLRNEAVGFFAALGR